MASWVSVDYDWDFIMEDRQSWLEAGLYIPWNNALAGVKSYEDRLFVTIPRWRTGVVGTLNEVVEEVEGKPLLRPWPSLQVQNLSNGNITYVQSMEIDPTGVMWVIDAGIMNNLEPNTALYSYSTPRLILIDISTGLIQSTYDLSKVSIENQTFINDIVVDYKQGICYISDSGPATGGLIVVNINTGFMARYEGPSTMAYPTSNNMYDICGTQYELGPTPSDGIALDPIGQRLYYCALAALHLYSLDAKVFANPSSTSDDIEKTVIDHGDKEGISDGLIISNNGLLYYGNNDHCTVNYWNISEGGINSSNIQTLQQSDPANCNWVDTFGFDDKGNLLATTNKLPLFANLVSDFTGNDGANFRVLSWFVDE
eukprot:CAMPEP_0201528030 /NCGR_PEP_ID=MMETSP0161_2-20130828/37134_1 /ASSEMBLY_ACC=CAM_ASM_000251 /TAXON_ID=180227 /ORGANISM="Neoparamoeba aestuarina, Strain SoJaBio B1-5/56/2" /LENGTH=369 /DNA_ID=CAMNT_0047929135 /DNA_START=165 /DNA_END=1271 /DNA_ORIENTATION=-